jgi:hypothetical protein
MVLSNLQTVSWPAVDLPAIPVKVSPVCNGRLHPHFGEFDVQALVREHLHYEPRTSRARLARCDCTTRSWRIGANVGVSRRTSARHFRRPAGHPSAVFAFEPSRSLSSAPGESARESPCTCCRQFRSGGRDAGIVAFTNRQAPLNGSVLSSFASQFSRTTYESAGPIGQLRPIAAHVPDGRVLLKNDVEGAERWT